VTGYGPESIEMMTRWQNRAEDERLMRGVGEVGPVERGIRTLQEYGRPGGAQTGVDALKRFAGFIPKSQMPAQTSTTPGVPSVGQIGLRPPKPRMPAPTTTAMPAPTTTAPAAPAPPEEFDITKLPAMGLGGRA